MPRVSQPFQRSQPTPLPVRLNKWFRWLLGLTFFSGFAMPTPLCTPVISCPPRAPTDFEMALGVCPTCVAHDGASFLDRCEGWLTSKELWQSTPVHPESRPSPFLDCFAGEASAPSKKQAVAVPAPFDSAARDITDLGSATPRFAGGLRILPALPPRQAPSVPALSGANSHYSRVRMQALQNGADPSMHLRAQLADLYDLGDAVTELQEFGTNHNTLKKDDRAWSMWEFVCRSMDTSPFRTADDVRLHPERNAFLLVCLMMHAVAVCVPKTPGRLFIKPRSALAYPLAIIRVFARWGIAMPSFKALQAQLNGMMRQYVAFHGPHSLAPRRAEPMKFAMVKAMYDISLDSNYLIGGLYWNSSTHDVFIFRTLILFLIVTAFRLGEIVYHQSGEIMFITRACLCLHLDGMVIRDPTMA